MCRTYQGFKVCGDCLKDERELEARKAAAEAEKKVTKAEARRTLVEAFKDCLLLHMV